MLSFRGEDKGHPNGRMKSRNVFFKLTKWYVKLCSKFVSTEQMLAINYSMELVSSYKSYPLNEAFNVWHYVLYIFM